MGSTYMCVLLDLEQHKHNMTTLNTRPYCVMLVGNTMHHIILMCTHNDTWVNAWRRYYFIMQVLGLEGVNACRSYHNNLLQATKHVTPICSRSEGVGYHVSSCTPELSSSSRSRAPCVSECTSPRIRKEPKKVAVETGIVTTMTVTITVRRCHLPIPSYLHSPG